MSLPVIHRENVPPDKIGEFANFVFPSQNPPADGPIDPQPATVVIPRKLAANGKLLLPPGVTTFEGQSDVDVWLIEDPDGASFPAKAIRVPVGTVVHAPVGASFNSHTIHWHGIEPTPMNDGVGHTSFEFTSAFVYQFQPNTPGTYFYHCHKNTVLHFEMGLYGAFIVDPFPPAGSGLTPPYANGGPGFAAANAPTIRGFDPVSFTVPYDVEAAWVPDEFDSRWHKLGHNAFMQDNRPDDPMNPNTFTNDGILNDFRPDIFLISGVVSVPESVDPVTGAPVGAVITDPRVAVTAGVGQNILLRLIFAGYTLQELTLGIDAMVIGEDGHPLGVPPADQYSFPFVIPANTPLRFTAGRHWDLLVTPTAAGVFPFSVKYIDLNNGKVHHIAQTVIQVT
jgi:hypothetical protein